MTYEDKIVKNDIAIAFTEAAISLLRHYSDHYDATKQIWESVDKLEEAGVINYRDKTT